MTTAAHQQTALQLGEEGTVLLKNNGILPLNPNGTESIAVIGTDGGAAVELAGGGSGGVDSSNTVWPITGIQNAVGPNVKVTYTAGDDNGTADIPQAVAAAQAATDAIIFVSAPEGEESDLTTLDLSSTDETMIADVAAANPNTIVVINSGSPVVMPWLNSVAGVFENWYGGQETGAAIAALIFGTANPSGKLPVTFPASLSQVPAQTTAQWPGTADRGDLQRGRGHRLPLVPVAEHHPAVPVRVRAVLHQVLLLQPERRRVQRRRPGHGDRDGDQHRVGGGRGRGSAVRRRPGRQPGPAAAAGRLPAGVAEPGASTTVSFPLTIHDLASWSAADNAVGSAGRQRTRSRSATPRPTCR